MKRNTDSRIVLSVAGVVAALAFGPAAANAASATWNVAAAGNWADGINWTGGAAPGTTSDIDSTDVATIVQVSGSGARAITVDTDRNIFGIDFAGNNSAYTLSGGNLLLTNGGYIQTSGGGSGHTDTISSAIRIQGNGGAVSFTSDSATAGRLLSIGGGITGVSTAGNTTVLNLNGTNTGNNAVGGIIENGSGGGNVAVVKSGTGAWNLNGVNTYTGGTTIREGTVRITQNANLGTGGTLLLGHTSGSSNVSLLNTNGSADQSFSRNIVVQSGNDGVVTYGSSFSGTRNHTYSGTIQLGSTGGVGHGITLAMGGGFGSSVFSAAISDPTGLQAGTAGVVTITGGANGILRLSGANTFTGGVHLQSGRLALTNSAALGSGTFIIDGGNLSQLFGSYSSSTHNKQIWRQDFSASGTNLSVNLGNGAVDLGDAGTDTTRILTQNNSGGLTVGGVISSGTNGTTVNFTKAGTGQLTLSGASTYSGATAVTGGLLTLSGGANRLPTSTTLSVSTGARVNVNGQAQSLKGMGGTGIVVNSGGTTTLTITDGLSTFDGNLTNGANVLNLLKSTGGTQTLNGDNSYTGTTTVIGGTLIVNGSSAAAIAGQATDAFLSGVTTLTTATTGLVVGQKVSGTGIASGTYIRSIDTGLGTILLSADTTGAGSAINLGAYSATGTGAVAVGGATSTGTPTLGGDGSILGNVTINSAGGGADGHIAPGASAGQLTVGANLTIDGVYDWEFDNAGVLGAPGANFDQIVMTGAAATLSTGGTLNIALLSGDYEGAFWATDHTWTIIDVANTSNTAIFNTVLSSADPLLQGSFSTSYGTGEGNAGDVLLTWTAVPEPASLGLLGAGAIGLLARRRRTRAID